MKGRTMKQVRYSQSRRQVALTLAAAGALIMNFTASTWAQEMPTAMHANVLPIDSIAVKPMPALDLHAIALEDALSQQSKDCQPRYAIAHPEHITPATDGTWEMVGPDTM